MRPYTLHPTLYTIIAIVIMLCHSCSHKVIKSDNTSSLDMRRDSSHLSEQTYRHIAITDTVGRWLTADSITITLPHGDTAAMWHDDADPSHKQLPTTSTLHPTHYTIHTTPYTLHTTLSALRSGTVKLYGVELRSTAAQSVATTAGNTTDSTAVTTTDQRRQTTELRSASSPTWSQLAIALTTIIIITIFIASQSKR